jgi:CRP/FNR family transcriptional regulator
MNLDHHTVAKAKMKRSEQSEFLRKISLFACLSEEELAEIVKAVVKKRYSKNDVVLQEKDTKNFMYFVFSGTLRVAHVTQSGKEHILAIHQAGDFFGEMALLDGKTLPASVVSMEDSTVGLLSRHDFNRHLLQNSNSQTAIILMLCARLREAWLRLKVLSYADAEQRVRAVLRMLCLHDGVPCEVGTLINLRITHHDIANYASLSRETVSRIMSRFLKAGEIEITETRQTLLKSTFFEKTSIL